MRSYWRATLENKGGAGWEGVKWEENVNYVYSWILGEQSKWVWVCARTCANGFGVSALLLTVCTF